MKFCWFCFTLIFLFSCSSQEDSLDQVKNFRPDDTYFKSNLVTLHFVTEVRPIPEVDAVSGASYSLYRFRYAVMIALMKASLQDR